MRGAYSTLSQNNNGFPIRAALTLSAKTKLGKYQKQLTKPVAPKDPQISGSIGNTRHANGLRDTPHASANTRLQ
jgi:hypothetical protein